MKRLTADVKILDGAMGTMLQSSGLELGKRPETLSVTAPQTVEAIHRQYVEAGAQMILTNTFCANAHKLQGTGFAVREVVFAAVKAARRACEGTKTQVALDIGPIGEMLQPLGTLSFEQAYELFREMILAGVKAEADAIFFETFSDLQELRAAVLAAKETCDLPVFASMTFEESGRTFLGCRADAAAMTLTGLGVSAVGMNCSLGPREAKKILEQMRAVTDLPLILKPNAGLPDAVTGQYTMSPEEFASACAELMKLGVVYAGGCCGTMPAYIRALAEKIAGKTVAWQAARAHGVCSSCSVCLFDGIRVIGERINPTGKKRLAQALREGDMQHISALAIEQQEAGAQILDINVGIPGVNEPDLMRRAVLAVSAVCDLPLQIDSSDPEALEAGLRAAPGKCLINSVNASEASLSAVLPLAKRYGAAVVGLTLPENGLPGSADERIMLAEKIIGSAAEYGIEKEDIAIDCLTLTVSAQQDQAAQTLKALETIRKKHEVQTVLGVSNISFGLPERQHVTTAFLIQAIHAGLTLPIVNPNNREIMDAVAACRVLCGEDASCVQYIGRFSGERQTRISEPAACGMSLSDAIEKGMSKEAAQLTAQMLQLTPPLQLVEQEIIPALDRVGDAYEQQRLFLPQLMNAASAAGAAFEEIKRALDASGVKGEEKGPVLLATVEGDIHDIGKNIVHTVVENYDYKVIDLGRDVKVAAVVEAAKEHDVKVICLSALMTTTVPGMERTITALHEEGIHVPVIVGGAVLTEDYAQRIGADYYAKDAKQCADIVRMLLR